MGFFNMPQALSKNSFVTDIYDAFCKENRLGTRTHTLVTQAILYIHMETDIMVHA